MVDGGALLRRVLIELLRVHESTHEGTLINLFCGKTMSICVAILGTDAIPYFNIAGMAHPKRGSSPNRTFQASHTEVNLQLNMY